MTQWRQHTLESAKRCHRYYQLRELEGWGLREEPSKMTFGTEFHLALECYELEIATGYGANSGIMNALENIADSKLPTVGKYSREQLLRGFSWYTDWAADDPLTTVCLDDVEVEYGELKARVPHPLVECEFDVPIPGTKHTLGGRADRIVEHDGALWVLDHKTTETTISNDYFARFGTAEQVSAYTWAVSKWLGRPVAGFIIDAIQVYAEGFRFMRGVATRTPAQLDEWLRDTQLAIAAIERSENADYFPMNTAACSVYGKCLFRDSVCAKAPHVRPQFLAANYVKKTVDVVAGVDVVSLPA